ncbi:hypothetical protein AB0K08_01960 [Citricoccus sp. NPDC055426]|uniref:hypothetical protein n=1 Tax=Citricoccus sp. NPDC055426 TaxID=3155536 RepID=UPI00342D2797
MAGDNVGSWFAVGTIGSIITAGAASAVPWYMGIDGIGLNFIVALCVASGIFALVALIAFAGFLNLVVRYLREISDQTYTERSRPAGR